jgi:hypothetical protein
MEPSSYANDICNVVIDQEQITISDNTGNQTFLPLDFYAIFGYLTYHQLI